MYTDYGETKQFSVRYTVFGETTLIKDETSELSFKINGNSHDVLRGDGIGPNGSIC